MTMAAASVRSVMEGWKRFVERGCTFQRRRRRNVGLPKRVDGAKIHGSPPGPANIKRTLPPSTSPQCLLTDTDYLRTTARTAKSAKDCCGTVFSFGSGTLLRCLIEWAIGFGVALAAPVLLLSFSIVLDLLTRVKSGLTTALAEEKRVGVAHVSLCGRL